MKQLLFSFVIIFALLGCECEDGFLFINLEERPDPFLVENVETVFLNNNNFQAIIITFNKPVDTATAIVNQSLLLEGSGIEVADFFETGSTNVTTLLIPIKASFILENQIIDFCYVECGRTSCELTVRLQNEENFGIRSIDGQLLDGDEDGTDGGTFEWMTDIEQCLN